MAGYRMVAYKTGDSSVRLISPQGVDHTSRFGDLAAAVAVLPHDRLILDGEVTVFDAQLVSRFEWLQRGTKPTDVATPPILMAFDALLVDGQDLRPLPLTERRKMLDAIEDQTLILPVRRLALDGLEAWQEVLRRGYEGMVAKDAASSYVEGRTLAWRKVKVPKYREVERGCFKP